MLDELRKPSRAKSILAYLIFGAIIIVFIGFGVTPDRLGQDAHGVAAVVNRQQISLSDFRDRVQAMERQYQSRMDQIPADKRSEMNRALRQRALEDLIQFEVMVQAAAERGVTVSDEEIRDTIVEIPAFQEEGRFKRDNYDRFLKERQWAAGQFEDKIRKDIMMRKVQTLFQDALKPTAAEKSKDQTVDKTKIKVEVLTFNEDALKQKIPVSDSEAKAWLASKENTDKVAQTYKDNASQFAESEQVKARHILLAVDRSKPESDAEALKKAKELFEKAKTEDFAQLATKNSSDPGSKNKGGDLGYFGKGRMVPEFEKAAFALKPGEVSQPVKSDFGYHIIKVEDHKPARQKPLEEVQAQLARAEIAKGKVTATLKQIEDKIAAKDEAGLRQMAKALDLPWMESGEFTLDAAEIPHVNDADRLIEAIVKHKTRLGLVPELIKSKGFNQVASVKAFSMDKIEASMSEGFLGSRKFYDAFSGWAKSVIGKASIKRNTSVLIN